MIHQFQQFFWFQTSEISGLFDCPDFNKVGNSLSSKPVLSSKQKFYTRMVFPIMGKKGLSYATNYYNTYYNTKWCTCKCTSMNKGQVIKNGIDMQCIYKTGKGDRKTNIEGVDWLELSFSNSILFNRNRITKFPISSAVIMQNHNHPPLPQYILNFELIYFSFSTRYI